MRVAIGVAAVLAVVAAGAGWLAGETVAAGVLVRLGLIAGAVWIAWPALQTLNLRSFLIVAASVLVVLVRPRAAWLVLPVLAIVLATRRSSGQRR